MCKSNIVHCFNCGMTLINEGFKPMFDLPQIFCDEDCYNEYYNTEAEIMLLKEI